MSPCRGGGMVKVRHQLNSCVDTGPDEEDTCGSGRFGKGGTMRRVLALAALGLAIGSVVALTGTAAYAGGKGAQTFTQTLNHQTDPPFGDFVPSRDSQPSITLTTN